MYFHVKIFLICFISAVNMKLPQFFKTIAISVSLVACVAITGLAVTGCVDDDREPDKNEQIKQAVSAVVDFLTTAKDGGNYSSVSEYYDGRKFEYYADDGKIRMEYNGTTYALIENGYIYKIYQADDMTWHKNNDVYDLRNPKDRLAKLIKNINNTLWSDYDSKTKTLTATYSDGIATFNLEDGEVTLSFILDNGTTTHVINHVGTTTVTLPEDIIDDMQQTE